MDEGAIASLVAGKDYDVVVDFIAFVPGQLERDVRSSPAERGSLSSSAPHQRTKSPSSTIISPNVPRSESPVGILAKQDCLRGIPSRRTAENDFPCTIVRPSHTYDDRYLPVAVHGKRGAWQVVDRILKGKPVLVHGDGFVAWTLTIATTSRAASCPDGKPRGRSAETFQITSDESLSWDQIYDLIGDALGKPANK
jgi:nucleoside-diphosphate-sugar epimerase